jgi:hypothetical protein
VNYTISSGVAFGIGILAWGMFNTPIVVAGAFVASGLFAIADAIGSKR